MFATCTNNAWAPNKATASGDWRCSRPLESRFYSSHSNRDLSEIKTHEPNKMTDKRENIF